MSAKLHLQTKSISSAKESSDGLRILATRFIPRATRRERYDVWMPNLGPSERLLKAFLNEEISWREFAAQYRCQLMADSSVDAENPRIKNHGQKFTLRLLKELAQRQPVTILCACAEDDMQCHRHLLKTAVERA